MNHTDSVLAPPSISTCKGYLEDAARGAVIETIAPQSGYQDPTSAKNQQPTLFFGKEQFFDCWFDNITLIQEVRRDNKILHWKLHKSFKLKD